MSDDNFDEWQLVVRPPHAATEEQVLECFSRAWAAQAARVLRKQLDAAPIHGSASATAALGELVATVYQLVSRELAENHCDSARVRSLFRRIDEPVQTQTVTRDASGRIAQVVTRRVG